MEFTTAAFISLLTLSILEVVLGIDNIVFISILSGKLRAEEQKKARRYGLIIGMVVRLLLLSVIAWIMRLEEPLINIGTLDLSGKDLILLFGGLFLLYQSTKEIHHKLEGEHGENNAQVSSSFAAVMGQMLIINVVFSLDSVITAIGMADQLWVMMTAVVISVFVMMLAADPISDFVQKHPSIKILALSFLLLIGFSLIVEALHYQVPKGYIYFAMAFSFLVDIIQLRYDKKHRPVQLHEYYTEENEDKKSKEKKS